MVIKRTRKTKDEDLFAGEEPQNFVQEELPKISVRNPARIVHVEPSEIISSLNGAVSSVNSLFQTRDNLIAEIAGLKEEIGTAKEVRVEVARVEALKRDQENFQYDFSLRKQRMEQDLERLEEERREKIARMEDETKEKLKAEADEQALKIKTQLAEHVLKLKTERDEHERRIKLEREDFERARSLFEQEKMAFDERAKVFEGEKLAVRERLVAELNRDNEHQMKVAALNNQREVEILRSQLKLEQSNTVKFETLLTDSRAQNDKLGEQLSTLSREALASASSSAMAVKLKDIVSQLSHANISTK